MEEENSVFGADAKNTDKINTEENFNFYHKNKETAKKDIDKAAKDFSDFMDSVSQDVPELSEEEINKGIEKILERTHPAEMKKSVKSKKVTLKVLFLVALLAVLSFTGLYVVGSSHNISIENGFVTFAKDTIKIVFFGEDKEEFISVDTLLTDLELHGYKDILFPQEFVTNSDEHKVSAPEYLEGELKQVSFNICNDTVLYSFVVHSFNSLQQTFDYVNMDNVQTIVVDDINMYIFKFDNGYYVVEFMYDKYRYSIKAKVSYSEILSIIETVKKGEK